MMKLKRINIERFIIILVTILALVGWARPFNPTVENLNKTADIVVQENPNLAVVLYTVADALDEGYIHSLAFVSTAFQERLIMDSIEIPAEKNVDIET